MAELPGMIKVRCDQCMFGLQVDECGLNKKPTGLLVNSSCIARRMGRLCDHRHFHAPTMNGRPKKAQQYPPEFCREIILGLKDQIREDRGEHWFSREVFAFEDGEEIVEEEAEEGLPEEAVDRGEAEGSYAVTEEEKRQVMKMHIGLGHPQKNEFVRFMRAARIKGEIIRWAHRIFLPCLLCQAKAEGDTSCGDPAHLSAKSSSWSGLDLSSRGRWQATFSSIVSSRLGIKLSGS